MDVPKINLLLMGKMRAGKTESTKYLEKQYGAQTWATSGRIKQLSNALLEESDDLGILLQGLVPNAQDRRKATEKLLQFREMYRLEEGKPRKLYQDVGQILRDVSEENRFCWENDLQNQIKKAGAKFVIVDARAWESHHFFALQRKYTSVEVYAEQKVREERMIAQDGLLPKDVSVFSHQSETDIDKLKFDFRIDTSDNNMQALYHTWDEIIQFLKK